MDEIAQKKKRTLKTALRDGSAFTVMEYFGTAYFEAFIVALGFFGQQLSALITIPQFFTSVSQLLSQKLIRRFGRFWVLTNAVLFQSVMIALFAIVGVLTQSFILMLISISLFYAAGSIAGNAWMSVMGDLVPEKVRGAYFSTRARIMAYTALFSLVTAGIIVQYFSDRFGVAAFLGIFAIAALARFYSYRQLKSFYDPEHEELKKEEEFSFFAFASKFFKSNFARFAYFLSFFVFSVFLMAPFFAFYQLQVFAGGLNYVQFTALKVIHFVGTIVSLPLWGRLTDKYGNRIVFLNAGIGIGAFVLGIAFATQLWHLMVIEILGGVMWAGFNLATANYIFDAVSSRKRALINSYVSLMRGVAILLSGLVSAILLGFFDGEDHANRFYEIIPIDTSYQMIFLVSGVLRILVVLAFWRMIKEVRPVEKRSLRAFVNLPTAGFRNITQYMTGFVVAPMRFAMRRVDRFEEKSLEKVLGDAFDDEQERKER